MKFKISYLFLWMIFITLLSCKTKSTITIKSEKYVPVDKELYETIVELDNKFFNAYNKCDLKTQVL